MLTALFMFAGAGWRIWDGLGWGPGVVRSCAGAIIATWAACVGLEFAGGWTTILAAGVAGAAVLWALNKGFDDWASFSKMWDHFWPAVIALAVMAPFADGFWGPTAYLVGIVVSGLLWPLGARLIPTAPYTMIAEGAAGAMLIGGLTLF